ncbi:MAG: hypothetical protein HY908_27800 [Myxococcales bacterium]|nr:hypothetical protein [Myxococcales bacterium]
MIALSAVFALSALAACGGPLTYTLRGGDKAPDADAEIVARVDSGASMTRLTVEAEHLAPPDRVKGGSSLFVVWARAPKAPWQRVGALEYDEGGRIGKLKEASVPMTAFELIITAESDSAAVQPSDVVIFSQGVNN